MTELKKKIHEMCPDGVPMVALGDLFDQKNGYTPSKNEPSYWENGNLPWFRMEDIRENGRILNDSILHITPAGLKKSGLFPANSIIVATSATIGEHALITVDFLCNQRFTCLVPKAQYKDRVDMKFYFYIMFEVDEWCKNHVNQGGFASVDMSGFSSIQIPLPPLPIQQRIVEILDKFTSLVSSLDSEIALRQKQYEYYRNKLLSFEEGEEGVEMKKSSEICEVSDYVANGSFADLRNNVTYKSEIDYALLVRTTDLAQDFKTDKIYIDKHAYAFLEKSRLFGGEIIINNIGAGVGKTFLCPERKERMCLGPNSIMVSTPNNRFYYYWFCSKFGQEAMMKVVSPGAMPKFNKTGFKTILLPIIPTEKMSKIVRTLDTFESLLTNLKKERELRQKQYEYYREELLTFA